MQTNGDFQIADDRFKFELHDYGPGIGIAPGVVDPRTGAVKLHHHIKVHLVRAQDGMERELFMHPVDDATYDIREFIRSRLNLELTRYGFEDIPERFDRPPDTMNQRCVWC